MKSVTTDPVLGLTAMTDAEFSARVKDYIENSDDHLDPAYRQQKLAAALHVYPSAVGRWAAGSTSPHPNIQGAVIRWIEKQMGGHAL